MNIHAFIPWPTYVAFVNYHKNSITWSEKYNRESAMSEEEKDEHLRKMLVRRS